MGSSRSGVDRTAGTASTIDHATYWPMLRAALTPTALADLGLVGESTR